jgi:ABC-type nickel/cobalt efflux system permease component RcnA
MYLYGCPSFVCIFICLFVCVVSLSCLYLSQVSFCVILCHLFFQMSCALAMHGGSFFVFWRGLLSLSFHFRLCTQRQEDTTKQKARHDDKARQEQDTTRHDTTAHQHQHQHYHHHKATQQHNTTQSVFVCGVVVVVLCCGVGVPWYFGVAFRFRVRVRG